MRFDDRYLDTFLTPFLPNAFQLLFLGFKNGADGYLGPQQHLI